MAYIGKKPEDAFRGLAYYDTFTGDGSTTTFDLSADAPDGGQNDITVVVDNVRQEPGASKSYTLGDDGSGNYRRITFNVAPDNLSEIYAINPGRSTQLNTVSDNAISAAKIQTDAVTSAKIADGTIVSSNIAPGTIANDRLANTGITINGTSIALGASGEIVAGTDWQAVTVADGSTTLNAEAGKGYFLDTNAGTIDVNLPTSPTIGDTIVLADYGNNFATNRVIVNTGGKLIDSVVGGDPGSDGFTIETNGAVVELVFADDTAGWIIKQNNAPSDLGAEIYAEYITATGGTITTSGDYKIHSFTGDGCFVVSNGGNTAGSDTVDYLVVAGGGGGGRDLFPSNRTGGGGGAGGFRMSNSYGLPSPTTSPLANPTGLTVSIQTYPVTVGGGGVGGNSTPGPTVCGGVGSNSTFSTITSAGGGGGHGHNVCYGVCTPNPHSNTQNGGSGGGSGGAWPIGLPDGIGRGNGNTPPVSPPQGNPAGTSWTGAPNYYATGGGGAGAPGGAATTPKGGDGGVGSYVSPSFAVGCAGTTGPVPSVRYFAGGGGSHSVSTGGAGGGGDSPAPDEGQDGTANTGGGAGGSRGYDGGAGGKGIVIIRYKFQN